LLNWRCQADALIERLQESAQTISHRKRVSRLKWAGFFSRQFGDMPDYSRVVVSVDLSSVSCTGWSIQELRDDRQEARAIKNIEYLRRALLSYGTR
jgi:hypothetical protein